MAKNQAYYYIGSSSNVYTKVYDGKKLLSDEMKYSGYLDKDSFQGQITDKSIIHVNEYGNMAFDATLGKYKGTLNLLCDDGYPQVYRDGVNVTDEYNQTQVMDPTFTDLTPGYKTFTIVARDITLKSATITKEYDGTALTAYSNPPGKGTVVTDLTAGQTDKGYVTDESFLYSFSGSQLFVGSSDNFFDVSDDTALLSDYNVAKQYGKLIVTQRTTPLTITVENQERAYDGTADIDTAAYSYDGDLAAGDEINITLTNQAINAGKYEIGVTYTIIHDNGDGTTTDVTDMYGAVTVVKGDLTISKCDVTITSDSGEKNYDGTPLIINDTIITSGQFVSGEGYDANVTGSQTTVGSSKNTFTVSALEGTNFDNYNIARVEGDLTVSPADCTITVGLDFQTGLTYLYDDTATKVLTDAEFQVSGLAAGDKVANVSITTNSANAGVYEDYVLTYDIVNAAGQSVKDQYVITEIKNDVEITKRTITIKAASDSKVYDGTALTKNSWNLEKSGDGLVANEKIDGVAMTEGSTITHAGSTANKIDGTNVTITKADGSDSSMNYNVLTEDGTLTVTKRSVLLISTSASKFYDGTALQNRQVIVTGLSYLDGERVTCDGFLPGDGCTYDFVGDDRVIDKDGNIIAWTVSSQSDTAYGQTDVGTSMNEFNYHNFTSVYFGSYETDYEIIYGNSIPTWFTAKYGQGVADSLFGNLTVWSHPVAIDMTNYSWTYDFQAKTNGYFDDGYSVSVYLDEQGTSKDITTFAHNSEGEAVALFGNDVIVVNVTGQDGSVDSGKVQHVVNADGTTSKKNVATYTIYRDGEDVTDEVSKFYRISISGGTLQITPRTVDIYTPDAEKVYDGEALTENVMAEGREGCDKGFIFGEGAAYTVTGERTEVGVSANTIEISKLLTDTQATDYTFDFHLGDLVVTRPEYVAASDVNANGVSDVVFQWVGGDRQIGYWMDGEANWRVSGSGSLSDAWSVIGAADMDADGRSETMMLGKVSDDSACIGYYSEVYNKTTWNTIGYYAGNADKMTVTMGKVTADAAVNSVVIHDADKGAITVWKEGNAEDAVEVAGVYGEGWKLDGTMDFNADGVNEILMSYNGDLYSTDLEGNFAARVTGWGGAWEVAAIGDFGGASKDIVIFHKETGTTVKLSESSEEAGVWSNYEVIGQLDAGDWFIVGAGDFNGDMTEDLLVRQYSTGMLGYYANGDMSQWNELGRGVDMDWKVTIAR